MNLVFSSWTFDDQGTGLPAPQNFAQIPNFAGTGRTLLRWTWNAGSGNLGVNQQVWINISTTIRNGAPFGNLSNDFTLETDAPGLSQRCSGSSQADLLDFDGDADTAETLCRSTGTITVAGIAQLISSKTTQGTCDGGFVSTSAGTLIGGAIDYELRVQNVGTVPMQNFVAHRHPAVRRRHRRARHQSARLAVDAAPGGADPAAGRARRSTTRPRAIPAAERWADPSTGCDPAELDDGGARSDHLGALVQGRVRRSRRRPVRLRRRSLLHGDAGQRARRPAGLQLLRLSGGSRPTDSASLAAEPQKVGIAIGSCDAASLGDFVWVDTNDDGIQNDGPTG